MKKVYPVLDENYLNYKRKDLKAQVLDRSAPYVVTFIADNMDILK